MSEWTAYCAALDFGALVPESYRRYRPAVADGLNFFLEHLSAERAVAILADQLALAGDATIEQRLVAIARHCPAMHKLGQILARDPRLPASFRALLQSLESMPSMLSAADASAAVEAELGPLAPRGIVIEEPPLAEASVAVVVPFRYEEGSERRHGVFKILKGGIEARLEEDLDLLLGIGVFLDERCEAYRLPRIEYEETFAKVRDLLASEVRLDREQAHMAEARHLYSAFDRVIVPELHYLSTPRVTAMERIFGRKVTDAASLSAEARHNLADLIVRALIARPLWSSDSATMFHADPHAGNLFISDQGKLAILDWSLVGHLQKEDQIALTQVLLGAITIDAGRIAGAIARLAHGRIDRALLAAIVAERVQAVREGAFPTVDWLMGIVDAAVTEAGARFLSGLLMFRKVLHTLKGVVADVSTDCRVDRVMVLSLITRLLREWGRRAYAEPSSREFATHFSNLDLAQLFLSAPLIGSRYALALQADLCSGESAAD